jgi:hypothetical protein
MFLFSFEKAVPDCFPSQPGVQTEAAARAQLGVPSAQEQGLDSRGAAAREPIRANGAAGHHAFASRMVEEKSALGPLVTG